MASPCWWAVTSHAVFVLGVADDRFDGGSSFYLALDGGCHPVFLAGGVDLEPLGERRVVALSSDIGEDAIEAGADDFLHVGHDLRESVAVVRIARQCLGVQRELLSARFQLASPRSCCNRKRYRLTKRVGQAK